MKLKKGLLLIGAVALLSPIGVMYGLASVILASSFSRVELKQVDRALEVGDNGLLTQQRELAGDAKDWATFDDTYDYMADLDPDYIQSNIGVDTFDSLGANFIIFIKPSGQIVYSRGFDLESEQAQPLPKDLSQQLKSPAFLGSLSKRETRSGILTLNRGMLQIAVAPILTSLGEGPSRGFLIFGRYLDALELKDLSTLTHVQVQVYPLNDPGLSAEGQRIRAALLNGSGMMLEVENQDLISGWKLIPDFYNKPSLLLQVGVSRDVYQQGQKSLLYLLLSLVALGIVFGCVFVLVINYLLKTLQRSQYALSEAKERAEVTLQSIGDAVITTNAQGQVESLNPVAERLTGWTTAEAQGKPLAEVFRILDEEQREQVADPVAALLPNLLANKDRLSLASHHLLLRRGGGEPIVNTSATPIQNHEGERVGTVLVFRDVTQERRLATQLSWQASHDSLTDLVNRREFERQLAAILETPALEKTTHLVCFLDLDRFKPVNDTCGHAAGDEVLRQISMLLKGGIRKADLLARLGGDEFGLLLLNCSLEEGLPILETLKAALQSFRFVWQEQAFSFGVSIGVAVISDRSQTLEELLKAADTACYEAKANGRNRIEVAPIKNPLLIECR